METALYLVTGQTGLEHALIGKALEKLHKSRTKSNTLKWYDMKFGFALSEGIENPDEAETYVRTELPKLWENLNTLEKTVHCVSAYNSIINLISREKPSIAVLATHMLWYRNESFFVALHPQTVSDQDQPLKPVDVITLIDDVYDIRKRIRGRVSLGGPRLRVDFTLSELVAWRDLEILLSTMLTEHLHGQSRGFHHIWSVKHPIENLWGLITRPEDLVIYIAYPISKIRGYADRVGAVDSFRSEMHLRCIVCDPLTIDEYPLLQVLHDSWKEHVVQEIGTHNKMDIHNLDVEFDVYSGLCTICNQDYKLSGNVISTDGKLVCDDLKLKLPKEIVLPTDKKIKFSRDKRWVLYPSGFFSGIDMTVDAGDDVTIPAWELMGATKGINSQIRSRDFQLIERADGIVAFRPDYKRYGLSAGVNAEIEFALSLRSSYGVNLGVFTIWPNEDGPIPFQPGAFGGGAASNLHYAGPVDSTQEAAELLDEMAERKKRYFKGWNVDNLVNRKKSWYQITS